MAASKKPRKKYVPKPQRQIPIMFRHNSESERTLQLLPHVEYMKLKNGIADEESWNTLACRLNIGQKLAHNDKYGEDVRNTTDAAITAIKCIYDRFKNVGKFGATGDELLQIGDALNLTDELQKASTRRELLNATEYVFKHAAV